VRGAPAGLRNIRHDGVRVDRRDEHLLRDACAQHLPRLPLLLVLARVLLALVGLLALFALLASRRLGGTLRRADNAGVRAGSHGGELRVQLQRSLAAEPAQAIHRALRARRGGVGVRSAAHQQCRHLAQPFVARLEGGKAR